MYIMVYTSTIKIQSCRSEHARALLYLMLVLKINKNHAYQEVCNQQIIITVLLTLKPIHIFLIPAIKTIYTPNQPVNDTQYSSLDAMEKVWVALVYPKSQINKIPTVPIYFRVAGCETFVMSRLFLVPGACDESPIRRRRLFSIFLVPRQPRALISLARAWVLMRILINMELIQPGTAQLVTEVKGRLQLSPRGGSGKIT